MPNSDAARAYRLGSAREATIDADSPVPTPRYEGVVSVTGSLVRELRRGFALTDKQVALLVSAALFVIGAWPLALTDVPPYQDLPNHLAAVTVIENPARYPELVFNGFFKTNAALFAWLYFVGKVTGLKTAARLFAILVLAANAIVMPRFVLAITGSRNRMLIASVFAVPLVHNWFVSMGMLDFALGVPLSFGLLLALDKQRRAPTLKNAVFVTVLGACTWYAHVFPLLVVHLLLAIEAARPAHGSWKQRFEVLKKMALPLLPVTALVVMSLYEHMRDNGGPMTAFVQHQKMIAPWELVYNLWAEWFWGFTKYSITSIVFAFFLLVLGLMNRRQSPTFFSPFAVLVLLGLYCCTPYRMTNWYHVNSRLIPFLWLAMLVRVPDKLPKRLLAVLGVSGLLYTAGMGYDFVRLDRDRQSFTAGIQAVPEGARLLPLLFKQKGSSENTRSLLHAWGFYVTEKYTSAPLLFAHSRSFPVMHASPPPVRFNQLVLENWAAMMKTTENFCETNTVVVDDCAVEYKKRWAEFWRDATPLFDHVLLWEPTAEAMSLVPDSYKVTYRQGGIVVMARTSTEGPTVAR